MQAAADFENRTPSTCNWTNSHSFGLQSLAQIGEGTMPSPRLLGLGAPQPLRIAPGLESNPRGQERGPPPIPNNSRIDATSENHGFCGGRSGGAGGGPGGREPPRDEPRDPKRKKEKPREVKTLWNSSAKPGTGEAYRPSGVLLNSFDLGGLWPGNNRGGPGGWEPPRDEPRGPKRKKEKPREVKIL